MLHTKRWVLCAAPLLLLATAASVPWEAPPAPTPRAPFKYAGTKSCATADCHGLAAAKGSPALNEYQVWKQQDSHARAFSDLYKKESKVIADALKIKNASQDKKCTSCHTLIVDKADVVPGETWVPQNGVTCEVCHGPAEKWLQPHTKQKEPKWEHAESVKNGMVDLRDPVVWASDCVRCHLVIDHEMIEAGHPRLNFEIVDYNSRTPPHWATEKHPSKQPGFDRKMWAVGQVVSLRESLKNIEARKAAGAAEKHVKEAEALAAAYRNVLKPFADPSGDLEALAKSIAAPGDDAGKKLAAVEAVDFESARQLALAYRALTSADTKALAEMVAAKNQASFDLGKFKAALDAVRASIQ